MCFYSRTHLKEIKYFVGIGILYLSTLLISLIASSTVHSTEFSPSLGEEEQTLVLSEAELAQALAPIALYPDTLLTHILIAATYPIEVIEADRWLNKNSQLSAEQLENKSEQKNWDISIKALLAFPQVIAKLSEDLTWMQKVGDAFLQDEARVLASIQTLRQHAEQAGSLANINNVTVIKEQKIIIIEPAQPEVIYVPYYDTRVVYGRWHWSHYPPVYWHNPHYYAAHYGHFYWGYGVHIRSPFYFSAFHWQKRHVIVSQANYYNRRGYHSRKKIVTSHQAKRWNHQPKHRRGVAYSHGQVKQKYYGSRSGVRTTNTYKKRTTKVDAQRNKHAQRDKAVHPNKVFIKSTVKSTKVRSSNVKNSYTQSNNKNKNYRKSAAVKAKYNSTQHKNNNYPVNHQGKNQAKHQVSKKKYSPSKQAVHKQTNRPKKKYKTTTRRTTKQSAKSSKQQQSKKHMK